MKSLLFSVLYLIASLGSLSAMVGIDLSGRQSPPEIVQQAKTLVARGDYQGIDAMTAQIDSRFGENHDLNYFLNLVGVMSALRQPVARSEIEFDYVWARRKLLWKILLTPCTRIEDAGTVLGTKEDLSHLGTTIPFDHFERDREQFIALRRDTVALLKAYSEFLRSHIIQGYKRKPGPFPASEPHDPNLSPAEKAQLIRDSEQRIRNGHENDEQDELKRQYSNLELVAATIIVREFSMPPVDDEAVNDLLKTFPPTSKTREQILAELALKRSENLLSLKKIEAEAKVRQGK